MSGTEMSARAQRNLVLFFMLAFAVGMMQQVHGEGETVALRELCQLSVASQVELGPVWGARAGEAATPSIYHLQVGGREIMGASAGFELVEGRLRCTMLDLGTLGFPVVADLDAWWDCHRSQFEAKARKIASEWIGKHRVVVISSRDGRAYDEDRYLIYPASWKVSLAEAGSLRRFRLSASRGVATLTLDCHLCGGNWTAEFVGWQFVPVKEISE